MNDQDAIDKAFEMSAQWESANPINRGFFNTSRYCPDCEGSIVSTPEGWRCPCSQWRFMANDTAERRKLLPDEPWKDA